MEERTSCSLADMDKRTLILLVFVVLFVLVSGFVWWNFLARRADYTYGGLPTATPDGHDGGGIFQVAGDLEVPWALDFLPDGSIIFTERPGRIRLVSADGVLMPEPLLKIDEAVQTAEGGLLGIAVHPDFGKNPFIYAYYTYRNGTGSFANRVVRFRKQGTSLLDKTAVLDGIPGGQIHDGGRIKFGPDGFLYVTTGDAGNPGLAQDRKSLAGKILRIKDDGTIPPGNPFPGSPVYSLGHRNPEGLAWDGLGRLWETEHGASANDELNLIESGKNYGWPLIRGDGKAEGLVSPVASSGGGDTWAPAGIAYYDGSLFFAGLRGMSLYEVRLGESPLLIRPHLSGNFGRLRDVVTGPDNNLYVSTSNRDGRGVPAGDDDRILWVNVRKLPE